ncbi:hypothetical protein JCM14469_30810 [Desulfatiferula olefinivorans]
MATNHKQNVKKAKKQKKRRETLKKQSRPRPAERVKSIDEDVDLALAMIEEGHLKPAGEILTRLRRKHPRHPVVAYGLGVLALCRDQFAVAVERFEEAVEGDPDCMEAHFNLAVAYQGTHNLPGMVLAYRHVFDHGEPDSVMVIKAAETLSRFERTLREKEGVGLAEFLEGHDHFHRGLDLMSAGDCDKAREAFVQSLAVHPRSVQALGNLGVCLAVQGRHAEALNAIDQALSINPDYEPAQVHRAVIQNLKEGTPLTTEVRIADYNEEYAKKGRSYVEDIPGSVTEAGSRSGDPTP